MSYQERKQLFEKVEQLRERPLITYVTSLRPGMNGLMAGDAIRPFIDQLELLSQEQRSIDVLVISNGGDPITALRIMGLLRERFDKIAVLLPYVGASASLLSRATRTSSCGRRSCRRSLRVIASSSPAAPLLAWKAW